MIWEEVEKTNDMILLVLMIVVRIETNENYTCISQSIHKRLD